MNLPNIHSGAYTLYQGRTRSGYAVNMEGGEWLRNFRGTTPISPRLPHRVAGLPEEAD